MAFWMFYVTHASEENARQFTETLLQERLVACANTFPITSAYWWQGASQNDHEWVSIMKTSLALGDTLEARTIALHPYETPCIVRWQVSANIAYENWIEAETAQSPMPKQGDQSE